jgi:hypothetical protein
VNTEEADKARAEEYLAELPDTEFAAVLKRVRPPKPDRYPKPPRNSKHRNTGE